MSFRGQKGKDALRKGSGFNRASAINLRSSDSDDDVILLDFTPVSSSSPTPVSSSSPEEAFPAISVKTPNMSASRHQKLSTQTSRKEVGGRKTEGGMIVRENNSLVSASTADGYKSSSKAPSLYLEKSTKVLKHSPASRGTVPVFQSKQQASSSLSSKLFQKDHFESGAPSLKNEISGSKVSVGGVCKMGPKPPPKEIREVSSSKALKRESLSSLFPNKVKPHSLPHSPANSTSFHSPPLGNGGGGTSRIRKISSSNSSSGISVSVNEGSGVRKERGANSGGKNAKMGTCNLPSNGGGASSVKGGQATDKPKILNQIHQKGKIFSPVARTQPEKRKAVGVGRTSGISAVSQKVGNSPSIPTSPKAGTKTPQSGSSPLYNIQSHRPLKKSFHVPEPPSIIPDDLGTSSQSLPTNKSPLHSVLSSHKVAHSVKSQQFQHPPAQSLATTEKHKKRKVSKTPASLGSNANLSDSVSSPTVVKKYKLKRAVQEKPKLCVPAAAVQEKPKLCVPAAAVQEKPKLCVPAAAVQEKPKLCVPAAGFPATSVCTKLAGKSKAPLASTPLHKMAKPIISASSSGKAANASSSASSSILEPASGNTSAGIPNRTLLSSTFGTANSKPTINTGTTGMTSSGASTSVLVDKPAITATATIAETEGKNSTLVSVSTSTRKDMEMAEINESSPFEFSEDDYFEVLDSVDSQSLCSGYECSDIDSATTGSDRSFSQASLGGTHPHVPSNLVKSSHHPQISVPSSPSSPHSTLRSTYPLQRKQLARKSTAKRRIHYKLPKRELMHMKKHCILELKRVKFVNAALTKQEKGVLLSCAGEKKGKAKIVKPTEEGSSGNKRKHVPSDSQGTVVKRQKQSMFHIKEKDSPLDSVGSGEHQVGANMTHFYSPEHSSAEPLSLQTPRLHSTTQSCDRHLSPKILRLPPTQLETLFTSSTSTTSSDQQITNSIVSNVNTTPSCTSAKMSSTESNSPSSKKSLSLKRPRLDSSAQPHSTPDIPQSPSLGGAVVKTEVYTPMVHYSQSKAQGWEEREGEREQCTWSQRDEMYDMRLQETILKLALEGNGAETAGDKRQEDREEERDNALVVGIPLCRLSRTPTPLSGPTVTTATVTTRPLGMFTDKGVQAERGMIVDKEVLDAYLVVKLHEAMFEMKEQLQMMEAQVANIASEKENLEKTLQCKIKYIRDMTSTGFKPVFVDAATETDPKICGSIGAGGRKDTTAAQNKKLSAGGSRAHQAPMMADKATQIIKSSPMRITSASQTEGIVCYMPSRLQTAQQFQCLYRHPESELQLYIRQSMDTPPPLPCHLDDPHPIPQPNEQWLSESTCDSCARCVPVSQKVRFLRAMQEMAAEKERPGCARCIPVRREGRAAKQAEPGPVISTPIPKVCFPTPTGFPTTEGTQQCSTDKEAQNQEEGDEEREGNDGGEGGGRGCEKGEGCIPVSLQAPIDNLIQVFFKLKNLQIPDVLTQHVKYLLGGLHHLLAHLPVPLEPKKYSTSPSTPGQVAWNTGVKLQELKEALKVLKSEGENMLPPYFLAELTQLQQVVHDTLLFATRGIQNETFAYDYSGCIMKSDLHPPPWRNQDLQENPFFRRLCLDVGVRGIVQEIKKLQDVEMSVEDHSYLSGSDMESLTTDYSPTPSQSRQARERSKNFNKKEKLVERKRRKHKMGKVRAKRLCPNQRKAKTDIRLTIPAPLTQSTKKESRRQHFRTILCNNSTSFSTVNSTEAYFSSPNNSSPLLHQNDSIGSSNEQASPLKAVANLNSQSLPLQGHSVTDSNCTVSYSPTFTNQIPSPIQLVIADDSLMPPQKLSHTKTPALSPSLATTTSFSCPLSSISSSPSSSTLFSSNSLSSSASSSVSSIAQCTTHACNSSASSSNSTAIVPTTDYTISSVASTRSCNLSPLGDSSAAYSTPRSALVGPLHSAVSSSTTQTRPTPSSILANLDAFGGKPSMSHIVVQLQEIFNRCYKGIFKVSDAVQILSQKGIITTSSTNEYLNHFIQAQPAIVSSTSVRAHLPPAAPFNASSSTSGNHSSMEQVNILHLQKQANKKGFISISNNSNAPPLKEQGYSGGETSTNEQLQARKMMSTVPFSSGVPIFVHNPLGKPPYQIIPLIHPILPLPPVISGPQSPTALISAPSSYSPTLCTKPTHSLPPVGATPVPWSVANSSVSLRTDPTPKNTSTTSLSSASFTTSTSTPTSNSSSSTSIPSSSSSISSTPSSTSNASTSLPSSSSSSASSSTKQVYSLFLYPSLSRPPLMSVKVKSASPITQSVTGKRSSSKPLPTSVAATYTSIKSTKPIKSTDSANHIQPTTLTGSTKCTVSSSPTKNTATTSSTKSINSSYSSSALATPVPQQRGDKMIGRSGQISISSHFASQTFLQAIYSAAGVNQSILPRTGVNQAIPYMSSANRAIASTYAGSEAIPYVTRQINPSTAEGSPTIPSMARRTQIIPSVSGRTHAIPSTGTESSHAVNKQSTDRNVGKQPISSSMQLVALTKSCKKTQDNAMTSSVPLLPSLSHPTLNSPCSTPSSHHTPLSSRPTPPSTNAMFPSSMHLPSSSSNNTPPSLSTSVNGGKNPEASISHSIATTIPNIRDCDIKNTEEAISKLLSDLSNGVAEVSSRMSAVVNTSMSSPVLTNCGLINLSLIAKQNTTSLAAPCSWKDAAVTGMHANPESLTDAPVSTANTLTLTKQTLSKSTSNPESLTDAPVSMASTLTLTKQTLSKSTSNPESLIDAPVSTANTLTLTKQTLSKSTSNPESLTDAPVSTANTLTLTKQTLSKSTSTKSLPVSLPVSVCHTSPSTHSTSDSVTLPITSPVPPTKNHIQHKQSTPPTTPPRSTSSLPSSVSPDESHPAPLQSTLPVALLSVTKVANGLLIKWTFANEHLSWQTQVERYELYAFVWNKGMIIPDISQWGKVGEIKPLALPMAVTLTNFATGQCYAFSVKVFYNGGLSSRYGPPSTIEL